MKRLLFLLAACASLTLLAGRPADNTKLLYPSNRTGNNQLFVMNPDGTESVNLTNSQSADQDPAWSPDGKKIVFTSNRNGTIDLYVMEADGKNVKQITKDQGINRAPTWSPDGKKIAFASDRDGNFEIYVMDADGTNQTNISNDAGYDADPAWSPDGKKIAFASNRAGQGFRVYTMSPDGKDVEDLSKTDNQNGYVYPAWSPDGKKIVYAEPADGGLELHIADADGSNKKQLTKLGGMNSLAAWSPDGKKVAFQHTGPGEEAASLYIIEVTGGDPKEVIKGEGPIEGGRPAWKPK